MQPDAVADDERAGLGELVVEVAAEAAVAALAVPAGTRVVGMIEVARREELVAQNEAHGIPGEVDRAAFGLRVPVAGFAGLALAVGPEEIGVGGGLQSHVVVGAELEPGML